MLALNIRMVLGMTMLLVGILIVGRKKALKEEEACSGDAKVPAETIGEASAPLERGENLDHKQD